MRIRWGLAAALLIAMSCGKGGGSGGKPRVAVSIFPLHDLAKRVAGDRLDVVLILPPGRSEHGYDPSPKEMARVAGAKLGVFAGLGMDDWAKKIVKGAAGDVTVLELAPLLSPQPIELEHVGEGEEHHEEEGEHHDEDKEMPVEPTKGARAVIAPIQPTHDDEHEDEDEHHHEKGALDPHVWLDPVRMRGAVDFLVEAYTKLDPAGAETFRKNGDEVKKSLTALHADLEGKSKGWNKKTIVTFHGSMGYFASRYGLTIAAIIEPFPGREPTPKYMEEVLAAIKSSGAAALFSEPQLDKAPAKVIAGQAGVPLYELDPVGGTPGSDSYEKLLLHNAAVLDQALK